MTTEELIKSLRALSDETCLPWSEITGKAADIIEDLIMECEDNRQRIIELEKRTRQFKTRIESLEDY